MSVAKQPLMSPRNMAVTAIMGALAMITTGLGLALPGYLPLVNFELQGTYITIATMAAGPIGGIIVAFLVSLVSAVGVISFPFYIPHILVLAAAYKWIYARGRALGLVMFWVVSAIALFVQYWGWFWLYAVVFKILTISAMVIYNFTAGPYVIFLLIWALLPSIIFATTPDFVRPDWYFPYLKVVTAIGVVAVIALVWSAYPTYW